MKEATSSADSLDVTKPDAATPAHSPSTDGRSLHILAEIEDEVRTLRNECVKLVDTVDTVAKDKVSSTLQGIASTLSATGKYLEHVGYLVAYFSDKNVKHIEKPPKVDIPKVQKKDAIITI